MASLYVPILNSNFAYESHMIGLFDLTFSSNFFHSNMYCHAKYATIMKPGWPFVTYKMISKVYHEVYFFMKCP